MGPWGCGSGEWWGGFKSECRKGSLGPRQGVGKQRHAPKDVHGGAGLRLGPGNRSGALTGWVPSSGTSRFGWEGGAQAHRVVTGFRGTLSLQDGLGCVGSGVTSSVPRAERPVSGMNFSVFSATPEQGSAVYSVLREGLVRTLSGGSVSPSGLMCPSFCSQTPGRGARGVLVWLGRLLASCLFQSPAEHTPHGA